MAFKLSTEETSEGDGTGERGEEDEDGGREAHDVEGVRHVTLQIWKPLPELVDDAAKRNPCSDQRIKGKSRFLLLLRLLLFLDMFNDC